VVGIAASWPINAASQTTREQTITASSSLVLGDNDSRADARSLCYLAAKRRALEQAGVYVEGRTHVRNLQLKSDDVRAFTAAVARIEEAGHTFAVTGDTQKIDCSVRVKIDPVDMQRRLDQFANDANLRSQTLQQQRRISELEDTIASLTQSLTTTDPSKAVAARRQRQEALVDIKTIEAALATWSTRDERLQRLKRLASQYVKIGMTREEVRAILGEPDRSQGTYAHLGSSWSYGPSALELRISFDTAGTNNGLNGDGYVKNVWGIK
jgi:hypothetical protein